MSAFHRHLSRLALVTVVGLFAACDDDDDDDITNDVGIPTDAGDRTDDAGAPDDAGAQDDGGGAQDDAGGADGDDIVSTAREAMLDELLQAAMTAGLVETLREPGPFTVFAPTDDAFMALGAAAPTDPGLLGNVLLHHVVPGELMSSMVLTSTTLDTAAKTRLSVTSTASPPTVGGAPLSSTLDVQASNGIVHVIDGVMIPPTITETVGEDPDLSLLGTAVGASSNAVQTALTGSGPITVFAPVNSAFEGINLATLTQTQIDNILTYHVVDSQVLSTDLMDGQTVMTLSGGILTINISGTEVTITDAQNNTVNVITPDVRLLNGTVHLIDGVLMP
jgi:uncharacterized surface protein with fasciclin (FAS1) repeats